ncbi:hypothetical protein N44_03585 [Microcystis aeruginosa NIES-44]|uniref:Uncharacterized protein n=1 Tax=Microcystis aeruginosa NIES-44 TaxID=449439 RepID=A0A0A1VWH9_MICAE|nr:hypothetical protein N44_03585 [Microcystis aeruginosa NIES-44]
MTYLFVGAGCGVGGFTQKSQRSYPTRFLDLFSQPYGSFN